MIIDLIKVSVIFLVIILVTRFKKGLEVAMLGGVLATILLYGISFKDSMLLSYKGIRAPATIEMILAFYFITFMQRILEDRGHLMRAEEAIGQLFQSKRINVMLAPFVIGFLPSAGAVLLAAPIVRKAAAEDLSIQEQAFVASYYRHIPEAFMPTYSTILLAIQLTGLSMASFVLGMFPLVVLLFLLGYFFYVRKIDHTLELASGSKWQSGLKLLRGMWPILLTVAIIMIFRLSVSLSVFMVLVLLMFTVKLRLPEFKTMAVSAFEHKLILMTVMVMIFKEIIEFSGSIRRMAEAMMTLPISPVMIFALIFFFTSLLIGARGAVAIFLPMAYAAVPGGGIPLLILLMSLSYIAMQVTPTHICLGVVVNEFKITMDELIAKTLPIMSLFIIVTVLYYLLLQYVPAMGLF